MTTPRIEEMVEKLADSFYQTDAGGVNGTVRLPIDELGLALTEAHQAGIDEAVKHAEMEINALENTLEKSKELPIAIGHKRVYGRIKLISEYKGKLEAWKEIKEMLDNTIKALQDNK